MMISNEQERAKNLRNFFSAGVNSVTRERIFFNRLSFDLKIAAARVGYHLHVYEPDVDRDGFDIVVEDQDGAIGWFQLKAVLRSANTASWDTTVGFVRPSPEIGEMLGFDPVECGRGGGIILIEIDDTAARGDVVYSYTDFRILTALAESYLVEGRSERRRPGRPPDRKQAVASATVKEIREGQRNDKLSIRRAGFLEARSPDALLALMAMRSIWDFMPYCIQEVFANGVTINEDDGSARLENRSIQDLGNLRAQMEALVELLGDGQELMPFTFAPLTPE